MPTTYAWDTTGMREIDDPATEDAAFVKWETYEQERREHDKDIRKYRSFRLSLLALLRASIDNALPEG